MKNKNNFISLVEKWEQIARNKFISAERQVDDPCNRPTATQFVNQGAMCYFNCAQELRRFLTSPLPLSPTIDEAAQK